MKRKLYETLKTTQLHNIFYKYWFNFHINFFKYITVIQINVILNIITRWWRILRITGI